MDKKYVKKKEPGFTPLEKKQIINSRLKKINRFNKCGQYLKTYLNSLTGFTLIEIMVSFAILGLIMSLFISIYQSNTQLWLKADQMRDVQQNARTALKRMINEIRQAGYVFGNKDPGSGGNGPAISTADEDIITFNTVLRDANRDGTKDNNPDWSVNTDTETITFSIPAGTTKIQRRSVKAGGVTEYMNLTFPAVEVVDLNFEYKDRNGVILGTPVLGATRYEISYVKISLDVRKGAGQEETAAGRERIVLKGGVSPPNLR